MTAAARYRALGPYLTARFGCKVYKLSLDGGMTCPNRDGTLGTRGCIFCSGAGEFAAPRCGSVTQQLEAAKAQVRRKAPNARYIAYFQSFTNTYAPVERLDALFSEALAHPEVVALSVATRPDCLDGAVLALLARLRRSKSVWVELGLQTIHPQTAAYIRRGYGLPVYDRAVRALHAAGLEVITHMILGLPGETQDMAAQTAAYIGQSGVEGVKLHLLHVLRGTDLAAEYAAGRVPVLSQEAYLETLAACLRRLPPEVVIHRMTGDGAKRDLIAPLWSADKKRVLNAIAAYFEQHNVIQGQDACAS